MFHRKKTSEPNVSALKMQYPDDCTFVTPVAEPKVLVPMPQSDVDVADVREKVKARFSKTIAYLAK